MGKEIISEAPVFSGKIGPIEKVFFKSVFNEFRNELQLIADKWYTYPNGTKDVFSLIEMSCVGVLNNAVKRCYPNDAVLLEYSAWNENDKHIGRGDYLVKHIVTDTEINFLFEAKHHEYKPGYGKKDVNEAMHKLYEPFLQQGKKYYHAEEKYYKGDTYVVPLVFEWVRDYEKNKDSINNEIDEVSDFFAFYHNNEAGLMVYGMLEKMIPANQI